LQRFQQGLGALRHKDASHAQARAQSFFEQVRPFNAGHAVRFPAGVGQRAAKIFQTNILFTLYNAERHLGANLIFLWRFRL
jgi:hypothetical protein